MSSLKDARDMTLISHSQGLITDEELLLLLEENTSKNPDFSYDAYDRFDLEKIEEAECKSVFRVEKRDIPLLAEALGLPDTFTCPQRSVADGIEGLCMVLKRTSFPCRYSDMIYRFGRPVPVLSMVTNQVVDYIYQAHGHRLTQWNNLLLNPAALQRYADAIVRKGAPLENCFGFVDGTVRPICRPKRKPEYCLQWPQESPCAQVSINHTEWIDSQFVWTRRYYSRHLHLFAYIFSPNLSPSCTLRQIMSTFRSTEELNADVKCCVKLDIFSIGKLRWGPGVRVKRNKHHAWLMLPTPPPNN